MVLPVPVEVVPNLPDDLARDWWGLGTWALIVAGFVVSLTVLYKIKGQVVNGHTTPMRADMDLMRDDIAGMRDEMRGGFAALRGDLTEERATRRSEDLAIREKIARHHPDD